MPEVSGIIQNYLEGAIKTKGKVPVIESKSITENGTYTAHEGVDGYNPITVNVPTPEPVIQEKVFSGNGTYNPPEGVDGYAPVIIDVKPTLERITITENGTYTPQEGVDGFENVIVNVPIPASIGSVIVNKYPIVNNRTLQRVPCTLTQGKYYALYYYDDYLYPRSGTPNRLGATAFTRASSGETVDIFYISYANFTVAFRCTDTEIYLNNKIDNDAVYAYVTIVEMDASVVSPLIPS